MDKYYLPHSSSCFVCGQENEIGLKCKFYADSSGIVHLDPVICQNYAGFAKVVHGGIQTALLDEAMGWCGFTQSNSDRLCFTREIQLKFKKNVIPKSEIHISAMLIDERRGFYYTEGKIEDSYGTILTTAKGVFVPIPDSLKTEIDSHLLYLNDGRMYLEKAMRICAPLPTNN